ncbi:YqcI/YcgG family protein [Sphingomonas sp. QA11]|uniref:guanitoxin biosynthesis heme-dependent pre-guanitoxin N-hydroxylase GntA n=1 Tax=Sphingomonas sp. QA11 TaxID=2950605 RepID=UPI00234B6418|nr:guanitoxin biosynthesis heme-dependent pre-guanitoxin N-hydroxylase GntA [Sphingomonas sp. QA11]WCM27004.1 YqcI/YcgG family protein [Sphingomonas sp. QA11]
MSPPSTPLHPWRHQAQDALQAMLHDLVDETRFPCVGAKAALARGTLEVLACNRIDSAWDDLRIHDGLLAFATAYREAPALFRSFAVVFEGPEDLRETNFEAALWDRVQSLSDKDVWRGQHYDPAVSPDPENPHFSLSFGGEAFFIVGLHPHASRPARRFARPTMIFNLHDQFETLRAQGKYEGMREKILVRDEALAGSRNPMLARHGETSEARQYSGREVGADWRCPFRYAGDTP